MSTYAAYINGIKETDYWGDQIAEAYYFIPSSKDNIDWFEYWKKFNIIDKDSFEWQKGMLQAIELNQYAIWAINQMSIWGSSFWAKYDTLVHKFQKVHQNHKRLLDATKLLYPDNP